MQELVVYLFHGVGWTPVGLLQYEEKGRLSTSHFRYGTKYLRRPGALAIDPVQLPLTTQSFTAPDGFALFNGIRDAGPDHWGRYLLDKNFGRELSEWEYVAASGIHRAGALAFGPNLDGPQIYTPDGFKAVPEHTMDLAYSAGAVADLDSAEDSPRLKDYLNYGASLGGARPKATVQWNGKLFLAKFSLARDERNEPLVEFATMKLAAKCGLRLPSIDKAEALGRSIFLIERFDRGPKGPVPFVSGLTLTGTHESDYARWSYHLLVDAILKFSSKPDPDLRELFKRMVFNILVYNNDDHPRNFGFLHSGNGRWNLSPLYDVVPRTIHSVTYSLAMQVGAEGKKASLSNALSQVERFRLSRTEATEIIGEMQSQLSGWREDFQRAGVSAQTITALENSFSPKP